MSKKCHLNFHGMQSGLVVPKSIEFQASLPKTCCKSLQRISLQSRNSRKPSTRRLGAEKESRLSEWRIREVRRSRFPTSGPSLLCISSLTICEETSRKEATLRPLAHALSFVILRSRIRPADLEVLPRV